MVDKADRGTGCMSDRELSVQWIDQMLTKRKLTWGETMKRGATVPRCLTKQIEEQVVVCLTGSYQCSG